MMFVMVLNMIIPVIKIKTNPKQLLIQKKIFVLNNIIYKIFLLHSNTLIKLNLILVNYISLKALSHVVERLKFEFWHKIFGHQ